MRILITGSNGLLGQKLVKQCLKNGLNFIATSKGGNRNPECPTLNYLELDVSNVLELNQVFQFYYPTHVIHTAAITNVDYCEINKEECDLINIESTRFLIKLSNQYKTHFQFLSTDFVFDGFKGDYSEEDEVNPLSHYGKSKVEGELLLINGDFDNWSIVRTSLVYGEGYNLSRSNIVLWALDSLKSEKKINVVDDQFRSPTYVEDLAWGCVEILQKEEKGTFHLSGPEIISVIDLVYRVADYFELSTTNILPIHSFDLKEKATRPLKTGFDIKKSLNKLGYKSLPLEKALERLIK